MRPAEALAEGAEATEDVDRLPERGVVSSRSPMEEIGFWRVPTVRERRGNDHGVVGAVERGMHWVCMMERSTEGG